MKNIELDDEIVEMLNELAAKEQISLKQLLTKMAFTYRKNTGGQIADHSLY